MSKTEEQINQQLRLALVLSELYVMQGKKELATEVLRLASKSALEDLKGIEIRFPVICTKCHKKLVYGLEIESYNNIGECFNCQSGYEDMLDDLCYGDSAEWDKEMWV